MLKKESSNGNMHKSTSPNIYCPHTPGNSAGDLFAKPHTFKGWNRDLQGSGSIKMGHQWNHPAVEIFLCPHWRCIRIETPPATSMKVRRFSIWMFPKIGVLQNGWFIMENPIKMDDLGLFPYFRKHPIFVYLNVKQVAG